MFETRFKKSDFYIPPGPLRDFSMNLFLAKQVHHLLGFPSGVSKTFSQTLWPDIRNILGKFAWDIPPLHCTALTCFVSELEEILSDQICLLRGAGLGVDTIQGEPNVTWQDKIVSMER